MKIFRSALWLRPISLGLLFAAIGFSYALATSSREAPLSASAGSRAAISSNCIRPPATFVTDPDLGVVVAGSTFTRQILVKFGFQPHHFFFGSLSPSSNGVVLSDTGVLGGEEDDTDVPTVDQFEIRVQDNFSGHTVTPPISQIFTLTAVPFLDSTHRLQLVNGPILPKAVADQPYTFTLQANGGLPPYFYQFSTDADFAALPAGLSLNNTTGEILGKPVAPTAGATFSILATDSLGSQARKSFTLKVVAGTISSGFVATSGKFKLSFGKEPTTQNGRDSINMTIVLNKTTLASAGVRTKGDLTGVSFNMSVGGTTLPPTLAGSSSSTTTSTSTSGTLPTTFDQTGQIKFPALFSNQPPIAGVTTKYQVKLDPLTGKLSVKFSDVSLINGIGAEFSTFQAKPILPVRIILGAPQTTGTNSTTSGTTNTVAAIFDSTDVVQFTYKRHGGNAQATTKPDHLHAPAGIFLIDKVTGNEQQVGPNKDVLFLTMTGFMRQVGGVPINLDGADQVQIILGNSLCLGQFAASSFTTSGSKLIFVNQDPNIGLHSIVIDNKKGTIFLDTNGFAPGKVFPVDILQAGVAFEMPITITFTSKVAGADAIFDGQSSVSVFRKGNKILNK